MKKGSIQQRLHYIAQDFNEIVDKVFKYETTQVKSTYHVFDGFSVW